MPNVIKVLVKKIDQNEVITSDQLRQFCTMVCARLEKIDVDYESRVVAAMKNVQRLEKYI